MGNQVNNTLNYCCKSDDAQNLKEISINDKRNKIQKRSMNPDVIKSIENIPNFTAVNMPFEKQNCIIDVTNGYNNYQELDRIKLLEQALHKAPKLTLRVINSSTLPKGTTLSINAQGLEGSLRCKHDGITYFGCKKKSKPLNENFETAEILNDYIIHNKDRELNEKHRGRHFQIEYSLETNSYKIKDLGIGFGAFVKIDQPLLLKDNHLLSMGSSFLIINFNEEYKESFMNSKSQEAMIDNTDPFYIAGANNHNPTLGSGPSAGNIGNTDNISNAGNVSNAGNATSSANLIERSHNRHLMNSPLCHNSMAKRNNDQISYHPHNDYANPVDMNKSVLSSNAVDITIKIFGGPNYGDVYQFNSSIQTIKIGRMPDCEIRIEDNLLSKYQGSIKYMNSNGWVLYDGYNGKPSTNSNWLYLNDDFEIYNSMIFKANHTLFEVRIEPPPK